MKISGIIRMVLLFQSKHLRVFPIPILRSYLCVHNTIYFVLNESRIPLIDFTHFLSIMFGEKEPLDLNV